MVSHALQDPTSEPEARNTHTSPKARVKLSPLLVAEGPEVIDASPPAAPNKLPADTLNAPPMSALEPTEIALLPPGLDADKPHPISKAPLLPTLCIQCLTMDHPTCPLFLRCLSIRPHFPSLCPCQHTMKWQSSRPRTTITAIDCHSSSACVAISQGQSQALAAAG